MPTYLYRLHFTGPVHFGATGIGLEVSEPRLRSDSVTSGLINAFSVLGQAEEAVTALQAEKPAFVLSSLFPFGPGKGPNLAYAVPRLLTPPPASQRLLQRVWKEVKKLLWLKPEDAGKWLEGQAMGDQEFEDLLANAQALVNDWWATDLRPRVALDRTSQNSQIWFCGTVSFRKDAGLYGLVSIQDETWKSRLEAAFRLLGELGLGGERTYGMGQFEFQGFEHLGAEWESLFTTHANRYLLLSMYHPREEERSTLGDGWEAWDLFESRGYVTTGRLATTLKRKRLRFLTEGSVATRPFRGTLADVTPSDMGRPNGFGLPHPIYRSGLGFFAPMRTS